MPGEFTWPIVAISYIYLRKDQTANGERAALLYAFVQYVLSTAGQSTLVNYGFQGVPAKVLAVANQALADVNMPADSQMWTFETATNAGSGQKDFVISTKRRSFEEYSILELTQEKASLVDVAAVATVNTAMSAKVASLSAALVALETSLAAGDFKTTGCDCGSSNDDDNLVKDAAAVGTAAIIIALVALCVAIAGVVKAIALQKAQTRRA
ncbi:hypothetical protein M885DRAFT_545027 [Pelagophyceae sp. CCMP2097]|nr:hypothetical protein M885DRAFT_545027 [Pelagophyceae sp. CCMP2097]